MRNTTIGCFAERVAKGDDCHSVTTKAKPPEAAASGGFLRRNGTDEPYCTQAISNCLNVNTKRLTLTGVLFIIKMKMRLVVERMVAKWIRKEML